MDNGIKKSNNTHSNKSSGGTSSNASAASAQSHSGSNAKRTNGGIGGRGVSPVPFVLTVVFVALLLVAVYFGTVEGWFTQEQSPASADVTLAPEHSAIPQPTDSDPISTLPDDSAVTVYAIDVGQGDCLLLVSPNGKTMLVDAGESKYFNVVSDFLKSKNIERLDVVVATHPHSDHIGAMTKVINSFEIGTFYNCPVDHDTATYEKMLNALVEKQVETVDAWGGRDSVIEWDEACTVRILSPLEGVDYDDLNNWSIVLRVEYGTSAIILTGDAEAFAEAAMLNALPAEYFSAQVLKVGHHGSSSSTSDAFLSAVSPSYAIISLGKDNDYGHPHKETISKLNAAGIPIYRTDELGTITIMLYKRSITVSPSLGG